MFELVLAMLAGALIMGVAIECFREITDHQTRREEAAANRRVRREIERNMP